MKGRSVAIINAIIWVPIIILLIIGNLVPPIPNSAIGATAGWLSAGLFSLGMLSAGLFSVGIYSAGLYSLGIFSSGVFSIGIFSFGTYPIGIWAAGQYPIGIFTSRLGNHTEGTKLSR